MHQLAPKPTLGSRLTLRLKLTLWTVAIFAVIQLTLSTVVFLYQWRAMGDLLDERFDRRASRIAGRLLSHDGRVTDTELLNIASDVPVGMLSEPISIVLFDDAGSAVASTVRPAPKPLELGAGALERTGRAVVRLAVPQLKRGPDDDPEARIALQRLRTSDSRGFILAVAHSDIFFESTMRQVRAVLLLMIPVGVLAATVAGWLISGLSNAPLQRLRQFAGTINPETIDQDLEPSPPASRELLELETQLRETRDRLRAAFQAQDRFISSVAHEFKTPIAVVLTESQTLRIDDLPPDVRHYVRSVSEEMRRLGRMVESFLTLARLRGGDRLENPRPCNVNDFVMEAIAECAPLAGLHAVSIIPTLDDSLLPAHAAGDPELLRIMIDNLVRNAIRFSPRAGQVHVRVIAGDSNCSILVCDHGPGVPQELLNRVFDRFVQAPDEAIRLRGHGLGLAIAQGIAELHSGWIEVQNLPEGGCEFAVTLPLSASPAPA